MLLSPQGNNAILDTTWCGHNLLAKEQSEDGSWWL